MLNIKKILENPNLVKQAIINKGIKHINPTDVDTLVDLYNKSIEIKKQIERLRAQRNKNAELLKQSDVTTEERSAIIADGKRLKEEISKLEAEYNDLKNEYYDIWQYIPNIPSNDTPIGKDESDNIEIKVWGDTNKFDFEPKTHDVLLNNLGLLDTKRGVKVAGFRGYFLLGDLARLHWALLTYALDLLQQKGYTMVIPPTLVHHWAMFGTGHFPWGEQDAYQVTKSGLTEDQTGKALETAPYLVGTAEVPLVGMFKDELIPEDKLPIRLVGFSPAYRKEVGSHAKDLKGIIRVHEFWKIEQVIIGTDNYDLAEEYLEELTMNQEEILQALQIPYHRLSMCTGDMGEPQYKKFDLEAWFPGRNKYQEVGSHSIMGDFQARRNNIRVLKSDKTKAYALTLNGTAAASPRLLAALIENNQTENGDVLIPEVLQKYMFGKTKLEAVSLY